MKRANTFAVTVQRFFGHLKTDRNLSDHTIAAYRDAFRLLLRFLSDRNRTSIDRIGFEHVRAEGILAFLEHVEDGRHNVIRTRNARLAAIRSFVRYALSFTEPDYLPEGQRILAIPVKRTAKPLPVTMNRKEIDSILAAPNTTSWTGRRDHLLFTLLYNTGGRISEVLKVRVGDIRGRIVRLHGKGRKERDVPIWSPTRDEIKAWRADNQLTREQYLFANRDGAPLSRRSAALRLRRALGSAVQRCPSLRARKVTPHVFRHSTAQHLLRADVPLEIIALWMGHEQLDTTHGYVEADLHMKRQALGRLKAPASRPRVRRSTSHLLSFLEAL
jgi:integrase/recombinase XerD